MRDTTIVPYKPVGKGIPKMSKGLNISLWMHYLARISEPNNASHSQLELEADTMDLILLSTLSTLPEFQKVALKKG